MSTHTRTLAHTLRVLMCVTEEFLSKQRFAFFAATSIQISVSGSESGSSSDSGSVSVFCFSVSVSVFFVVLQVAFHMICLCFVYRKHFMGLFS